MSGGSVFHHGFKKTSILIHSFRFVSWFVSSIEKYNQNNTRKKLEYWYKIGRIACGLTISSTPYKDFIVIR